MISGFLPSALHTSPANPKVSDELRALYLEASGQGILYTIHQHDMLHNENILCKEKQTSIVTLYHVEKRWFQTILLKHHLSL